MIGGQSLTANIVTMSVFGAILMYTLSMLSLFQLRRREPGLVRPFRAPCYPWFPAIALAGGLGLKLVAEGVENEAQRDVLLRLGCHTMQGFLYAQPMPADELVDWVRRQRA